MILSSSSSTASAASSTPISPFSTYSVNSEPTSDELPDLGAFTTVFRALNHLQPPRSFAIPTQDLTTEASDTISSVPITQSDADSDAPGRIIASYLTNRHQDTEASDDLSIDEEDYGIGFGSGSGSDTEGEPEGRVVEIEGFSDVDADGQPSLGYLDEALSFIASERAKYTAQRDKGVPSENAWRHVIEPRRKRRRKRSKTGQLFLRGDGDAPTETTEGLGEQDADDSSSSLELDLSSSYPYHKSTPGTPPRSSKAQRNQRHPPEHTLRHSKSTPNLDLSLSVPIDPRVLQLRSLTHKLRLLFPEDSAALSALLSNDFPGESDFVDPRGPVPRVQDRLIHVFIDHSNILIGLLTYLKRYHRHVPRKPKHMSHAALALILERGRPITRRCLVASSPLYQPMASAEQLGYEVRVYARVPDTGDGEDRRKSVDFGGSSHSANGNNINTHNGYKGHWRKHSGSSFRKGHGRMGSGGNTSTESEQGSVPLLSNGVGGGFPQAFVRSLGSTTTTRPSGTGSAAQQPSGNGTPTMVAPIITTINTGVNSTSTSSSSSNRIRYREQGVDELLQLKLHQAIAAIDTPPPDATIVLATGDGNVGQFNEDGFLGPVRTALKKGWRVELYAWEDGLSRSWMREFGAEGAPWRDRFRVVGMEMFGADLMEV